MTAHANVIRELVALFNARSEIPIAQFFSPDFRLQDPGAGVWREGHKGARDMIAAALAIAPDIEC